RVALSWSPSTGSVAGYTVYRDGTAIGTTGPDSTIFLDPDVLPATIHTYTVDAFDLANDHSARSAPLTVATPSQSVEFVQGAADSPASRLRSDTLTLSRPVLAGDLLVGWFSQYNVSGQVHVSDNVNGAWTRSVSTTWGGAGDIALYYKENSAAALSGLTITVSANSSAYLQEAVADYRHVATVGALDQAVVSTGTGSYAGMGPTAAIPAGELVVAAVLTGGRPGWVLPGSSAMVPYLLDARNGSTASTIEDILSSAAGPQLRQLGHLARAGLPVDPGGLGHGDYRDVRRGHELRHRPLPAQRGMRERVRGRVQRRCVHQLHGPLPRLAPHTDGDRGADVLHHRGRVRRGARDLQPDRHAPLIFHQEHRNTAR